MRNSKEIDQRVSFFEENCQPTEQGHYASPSHGGCFPLQSEAIRSKPLVDSLFDIRLTPELDVCRATEIHSFYYVAIEEELDKKNSWGRLASDP